MTGSLPQCGLYLRLRSYIELERLIPDLRQAAFVINRSEYDQNMHIVEIDAEQQDSYETTTSLVEIIKREGLVALIRGNGETAAAVNADGVLVSSIEEIAAARKLLGDEKIIGIACGVDRKLAEAALKQGVDYVIFGSDSVLPHAEIFGWWATSTDVPAVACGPITNDNTEPFVKAGATFLDCTDYVWGYDKGVMQAVSNMLYAVELASNQKMMN